MSVEDALTHYDVSATPYSQRMENVYSRGRAVALLKAVLGRLTIQDSRGNILEGWSELFIPMLAHLVVALRTYYQMAFEDREDDDGDNSDDEDELVDFIIPPLALFEHQLEWTEHRWPELAAAVKELSTDNYDSSCLLAWDFPSITITAVAPLVPSGELLFGSGSVIQLTVLSPTYTSGIDAVGNAHGGRDVFASVLEVYLNPGQA